MRIIIFIFFSLLIISCVSAQNQNSRTYKRLTKQELNVRSAIESIIENSYHQDFTQSLIVIDVVSIDNKQIRRFCNKFNFTKIIISGVRKSPETITWLPVDSTITFTNRYNYATVKRKELIVDCSSNLKEFSFEEKGPFVRKLFSGFYYYEE